MARKKIKILLVEDEPMLSNVYEIKLEKSGFDVIKAGNGNEGFSLAVTELPQLILLDILMPDIDGYGMLKKLKAEGITKNIQVVIFSNLSQKEEIEKGLRLGARDFIIKTSITPSELVAKVKEYLKG